MTEPVILQPQPRAWLEHSILQPYVAGYGKHLGRGRYSPSTRRVYFCCVAHFAHWLTQERYALSAVDERPWLGSFPNICPVAPAPTRYGGLLMRSEPRSPGCWKRCGQMGSFPTAWLPKVISRRSWHASMPTCTRLAGWPRIHGGNAARLSAASSSSNSIPDRS